MEKEINEHDRLLVKKAEHMDWEDINESAAETEEGRKMLHDISSDKMHYEECKHDFEY